MNDLEFVDAQRLAEALERLEAGLDPDLDPREDPSLSALAALAAEIRDLESLATDTRRFESYRTRSRDHVLSRVQREVTTKALVPVPVEAPERRRIPFLHWSYLAPVAAAAAAAVAFLAFLAAQPDGISSPGDTEQAAAVQPADSALPDDSVAQIAPAGVDVLPPDPPLPGEVGPPLTPSAIEIEAELARIEELIATVARRVSEGAPVEGDLLRSITESTASVAQRIEMQPDSVSRLHVIAYIQAAADGRTVLATARADAQTESALNAARRATQDGVAVASAYFQQRPE